MPVAEARNSAERPNNTCNRTNETKKRFLSLGKQLSLFETKNINKTDRSSHTQYIDLNAVMTLVFITEYLEQPTNQQKKEILQKKIQQTTDIKELRKELADFAFNIPQRQAAEDFNETKITRYKGEINQGKFPFIPAGILPDRYQADVLIHELFEKDIITNETEKKAAKALTSK